MGALPALFHKLENVRAYEADPLNDLTKATAFRQATGLKPSSPGRGLA